VRRFSGIVGENGSGKTTLFKCIAGLEKHDGDII
jgi:ABC-2 type transport system ATP-binding protein